MNKQEYSDFLTSVGEAFCETLFDQPGLETASPHDFQEVLIEVFGSPLSPKALASADASEIKELQLACCRWFEIDSVPIEALRSALQNACRRWSPNDDVL